MGKCSRHIFLAANGNHYFSDLIKAVLVFTFGGVNLKVVSQAAGLPNDYVTFRVQIKIYTFFLSFTNL